MELTGTLEERIAAALEFAKAHRAYEYDHDKLVKRYRSAGVPYTEAAEKFCREWDGGRVNCFRDILDYLCSEFVFAGMPDFVECDYEAKEG